MAAALVAAALLAACAVPVEPEAAAPEAPDTSEVAVALISPAGQGTSYQGTSYQGTSYQGTSYQGTSYQGTSYQGATLSGTAFSDGTISGTALSVWRKVGLTWQERTPDQICTWSADRTVRTACTTVNLGTSPSPLAGTRWKGTFAAADGTPFEGTIQIGSSSAQLGAVLVDPSMAMHPLTSSGSKCALDPSCGHPGGCRANCDLWLYDVRLVDGRGQLLSFCPAGERAHAVADTWSSTGARVSGPGRFTFACTNGTISKCTQWGYRPFGSAAKSNGALAALAPYHQACVRAAAADYCAKGRSFTRDGTLIDIYDYRHGTSAAGLVPRTLAAGTALVEESRFDAHGATRLAFHRYQDLGNVHSPTHGCWGWLDQPVAPIPPSLTVPVAQRGSPAPTTPSVIVDSTGVCSHTEHVLGKGLHQKCSACTQKVWQQGGEALAYACAGMGSEAGWSQRCQAAVGALCAATELMAPHGECTAGAPLPAYASGCTLSICSDPAHASCCSAGGSWSAACVTAANQRCRGGQEGAVLGFCGAPSQIAHGG